MIYCASGDTLKGAVKLTFGALGSCLHSTTKERPSEQERSQMSEGRNGKLDMGAQHKWVLVGAANICIRSLWLAGDPVTEGSAGPSPVCPPATGTCESPSDTRISLSVDKLGLPLAGKQRVLTRSPDYSCTSPYCCSRGVARHFFGEQDALNTHRSLGLWTLPWTGKTFDSRAFWKFPCGEQGCAV